MLALLLLPSVFAFFPYTHQYLFSEGIKSNIDSNVMEACKSYPDLCYSGNVLTDVSVIYYYTKFTRYTVTHSPSFCRSLLETANTDKEMACAVGSCLHQAQDLESHIDMIPSTIKKTFIPNSVIHTLGEQHLDNIVLSEHPEIKSESITSLNSFRECTPLFKKVLQGEKEFEGVNLDALFDKFIAEVQGSKTGYDPSFSNLTTIPIMVLVTYTAFMGLWIILLILLIFKRLRYKNKRTIFNWISLIVISFILFILLFLFIANLGGQAFKGFVFLIKPISNLVPIGDAQAHLESGISNTQSFFTQGESFLFGKDASGQTELLEADRSIVVPQYIILISLIILLIVFIYFNFRRKK